VTVIVGSGVLVAILIVIFGIFRLCCTPKSGGDEEANPVSPNPTNAFKSHSSNGFFPMLAAPEPAKMRQTRVVGTSLQFVRSTPTPSDLLPLLEPGTSTVSLLRTSPSFDKHTMPHLTPYVPPKFKSKLRKTPKFLQSSPDTLTGSGDAKIVSSLRKSPIIHKPIQHSATLPPLFPPSSSRSSLTPYPSRRASPETIPGINDFKTWKPPPVNSSRTPSFRQLPSERSSSSPSSRLLSPETVGSEDGKSTPSTNFHSWRSHQSMGPSRRSSTRLPNPWSTLAEPTVQRDAHFPRRLSLLVSEINSEYDGTV